MLEMMEKLNKKTQIILWYDLNKQRFCRTVNAYVNSPFIYTKIEKLELMRIFLKYKEN